MVSSTCRRCQYGTETREHVFCECPTANETWEKLHITWSTVAISIDFNDWIRDVFESNSLYQCRLIACTLWALWMSSNKFVHEGECKSGSQVAEFVLNYLKELDKVNVTLPGRVINPNGWTTPNGSIVKINFDATYNMQKKESWSGLVARNDKAEVICSKTILHPHIPSGFAAEAMACL